MAESQTGTTAVRLDCTHAEARIDMVLGKRVCDRLGGDQQRKASIWELQAQASKDAAYRGPTTTGTWP